MRCKVKTIVKKYLKDSNGEKTSIFEIVRLLLPGLDKERGPYNMKVIQNYVIYSKRYEASYHFDIKGNWILPKF